MEGETERQAGRGEGGRGDEGEGLAADRLPSPIGSTEAGFTEFDCKDGWLDGLIAMITMTMTTTMLIWSHAVMCGTSVTVMS